ncbi:MAG: hypothetical protein RLZZ609_2795 [Cyanobacteriota bacterium]|jgi:hypothetical protein
MAPTGACCWWSSWTFPGAEQAPQGSGRQRPSFSVPRLRRGVHRPAAAALRSGAGVGVGVHGGRPAAAVAEPPPVGRGWGEAPGFLARLRGRLGIQG